MQTLTFKMLLRRPGTAESILAMALLIAILSSTTSVLNHINSQTETIENLLPTGETFLILNKHSTSITNSKVDPELANLIANTTDTKHILPQKVFYATLITNSNRSRTIVRGVDVPTFLEARNARTDGSAAEDMQANVGELLARLTSTRVGDQIDIEVDNKRTTVKVAGIIHTLTQSDTQIIVPMKVADSLSQDNRASVIEFALSNSQHTEINKLREALPPDVTMVSTQQTQAFIQEVNHQTTCFFNLWSIAVYATVTAASYIVATRLTIESSYELTMLRALGGRQALLFTLTLTFAITISLLASVLGVTIGLTGAQMISTIARWTWRSFGVAPFLEIQQTIQIILFTLTASILGSLYPAAKAMHKTYAEAPL